MSEERIHWTEDEELLAGFVLNRLGAEERLGLQVHLDSCQHCRTAVETESLIAAGATILGREQVKKRLQEGMRLEEPDAFERYQVIGLAAAVLVILIAIGFFRYYISSIEWPSRFSSPKYEIKRGEGSQATGGARRPQAGQGGSERGPKGEEGEEAFWLIGQVIMRSEGRGEMATGRPTPQRSGRRSEKIERVFAIRMDGLSQSVILRELPLTTLHPDLSERATVQDSSEVETLVEKNSQGLYLTLYRQTLLSASELERASIDPVTGDSLIVDLANERIAYRIPGGWSSAGSGDASTEKR